MQPGRPMTARLFTSSRRHCASSATCSRTAIRRGIVCAAETAVGHTELADLVAAVSESLAHERHVSQVRDHGHVSGANLTAGRVGFG